VAGTVAVVEEVVAGTGTAAEVEEDMVMVVQATVVQATAQATVQATARVAFLRALEKVLETPLATASSVARGTAGMRRQESQSQSQLLQCSSALSRRPLPRLPQLIKHNFQERPMARY
jgi:hypothetical protein